MAKLTKYKKWGLANEESLDYIKHNEVGFKVSNTFTKFTSTKRNLINYDWELKYDEIVCLAFGEAMIFDDDEQFIFFLIKDKRSIQFMIPSLGSEEMCGFVDFVNTLREKLDFKEVDWVQDKLIIAYPDHLVGKELYGNLKGFLIGFVSRGAKILGLEYKYSGVIKKNL